MELTKEQKIEIIAEAPEVLGCVKMLAALMNDISAENFVNLEYLSGDTSYVLTLERLENGKDGMFKQNTKLLEVAQEVLKVWNEDGQSGEIQMKTPIAWSRVVRKAEESLKQQP